MLTVKEILEATKGQLIAGERDFKFKGISTDSRIIKKNSLFIPLIGPRYDGHDFISPALAHGASGVLISKPSSQIPLMKVVIKVKDTLKALQNLAFFHRLKFKIPVIGVTGSCGKTTTKDMIASILSQGGKTLKTDENYNNEIGVPLTLLKLDSSHQAAVIEMAMQNSGEIEDLSRMVLPNIAVITNVGVAHLEYLKTEENIAKTKSEILKFLGPSGTAILPRDDKFYLELKGKAYPSHTLSFGLHPQAQVRAENIKSSNLSVSFSLHTKSQKYPVTLPLPGLHNVYNALAAAAVGQVLKLKKKSIQEGLKKFRPSSRRMEIFVYKSKIRVINDTYNANPHSMKAALGVLRDQGPVRGRVPPRRIAVLGDMLELGAKAPTAHKEIGEVATEFGIDILITIGDLAKYIAQSAKNRGLKKAYSFSSNPEAIYKIKSIIRSNDVILAKASRAMKLEEIVEALRH